jgi:homoserine O-acetyltransferase
MAAAEQQVADRTAASNRGGLASDSSETKPVCDWSDGILDYPGSLRLHHGALLDAVRIGWRLSGPAAAPVIAVLGGISASRIVRREEQGWWPAVVGDGLALDTRRYRVLGIDFLGGSGHTTGPRAGVAGFPAVSSYDQARLLAAVLDGLGIPALHAFVGASYGGMVALAFGELFPARARHLLVISGAHRTHPQSTAWRGIQREIVRFGIASGNPAGALKLARALGMATYRTPAEFAERFAGEPSRTARGFSFPVEQYLLARGEAYAAEYVPESFICLSESIDLHRVEPQAIHTPTTLVAVREDQLVPLADMADLRQQLAGPADLRVISSRYGHDAFLKEGEQLRPIFAAAFGEVTQ